jgi:hypothetical protein
MHFIYTESSFRFHIQYEHGNIIICMYFLECSLVVTVTLSIFNASVENKCVINIESLKFSAPSLLIIY